MSSRNYTEEEFKQAVKNSYSYTGVCRLLGITPKGGNLKTVKNKIEQLGLNSSHFTGQRWNKGKTSKDHPSIKKRDLSEVLVLQNDKKGWSSSKIRQRLIEDGVKEAKCELCGKSEWMGVPIPLELHHINGNHYDNRLENLLILCPNCHALTDSHCNTEQLDIIIRNQKELAPKMQEALLVVEKQKKEELKIKADEKEKREQLEKEIRKANKEIAPKKVKETKICPICGEEFYSKNKTQKYCSQECSHKANGSKRPDIFELIDKFKELKSFVQVSNYYGVSDNAVRKWCKLYNLPIKSSEMKEYIRNH